MLQWNLVSNFRWCQWGSSPSPLLIRDVLALSLDQYELTPSSQWGGLPLKSSANQRPSMLRAESPEERREEIMASIMATSLSWRTHSARTKIITDVLRIPTGLLSKVFICIGLNWSLTKVSLKSFFNMFDCHSVILHSDQTHWAGRFMI
jgi:hypothetical protein